MTILVASTRINRAKYLAHLYLNISYYKFNINEIFR